MSSKDVSGGIWRFLIGLIVTPIIVVAVLVGCCTEDADHRQPPQPTPPPGAAAAPSPPAPSPPALELPAFKVDATKIIGKPRAAVLKYLGKPTSSSRCDKPCGSAWLKSNTTDTFDLDLHFSLQVQFYQGQAAKFAVAGPEVPAYTNIQRVREWAGLPEMALDYVARGGGDHLEHISVGDLPSFAGTCWTRTPVTINGLECKVLMVLGKPFQLSVAATAWEVKNQREADEFKKAPAQSSSHSPAASNEPARFEITAACKKAVLRRLKAPGSAEFPGVFDDVSEPRKRPDGSYLWGSWVDSQNSFGAKLRTRFMCEFANGVATVTMER